MEEKVDWAKKVEESNGKSMFVPDALLETFKDWRKDNKAYAALSKKYLEELAELQISTDTKFQNLMLDIRKHLKSAGRVDAWTVDLGLDIDALEGDEKFVINFTERAPRQ